MHADGSSSPNGKLVLSIIKKRGTSSAYWITGDDGSSFLCPSLLVDTCGLKKGSQLSEGEWNELAEQALFMTARDTALSLLARREYTHRQLAVSLQKRRFPEPVIRSIVNELSDEHSIDHSRYAHERLRSRIRKNPESLNRLRARLTADGLSDDEARCAIARLVEDDPGIEIDLCRRAARRLAQRNLPSELIRAKLAVNGFPRRIILEAIEDFDE